MDTKRAMSNTKKRKIESPVSEGKRKVKPNEKKTTIVAASQPTTAVATVANKLSKKKEKRKLFKKEIKKKLLKEGKLSWKKKKMEKKKTTTTVTTEVTSQVAPPKNPQEISANWKALQQVLQQENGTKKKKKGKSGKFVSTMKKDKAPPMKPKLENAKENGETKPTKPEIWFEIDDENLLEHSSNDISHQASSSTMDNNNGEGANDCVPTDLTYIVGLDCEMVGVGEGGVDSILARVSIVNQYGHPVYDKYVKPTETVTDYRTAFSGIRPHNLGQDALPFKTVQSQVAEIIKDRVLVGHSLYNDMQVLFLSHHHKKIRDTQKYKPFKKLCGGMPSLKKLAATILNVTVQTGEHSSVEDAQTAMRLYMTHRNDWEKELRDKKTKSGAKKKDA